jgi:Na+-transporting methylmalonyl-CoA/oxaloacetate decarboxylase gamma subunit
MVLPFLGILGGIPFVNKVTPYVLGMPLILFWLVAWVVITSVIMAVVYRFDPEVREEERT